jgi:hypothetical protein
MKQQTYNEGLPFVPLLKITDFRCVQMLIAAAGGFKADCPDRPTKFSFAECSNVSIRNSASSFATRPMSENGQFRQR